MDDTRDRSGLILAFGIIQIVLGGLAALFALIGAISLAGMARLFPSGSGAIAGIALFFYLLPATNLLLTGIGSVRFRPWARLATIVSAAIWAGLGVLSLAGQLLFLFGGGLRVGHSRAADGEVAMLAVILVFVGLLVIGFPVSTLVAYTRRGVKETFQRRSGLRPL